MKKIIGLLSGSIQFNSTYAEIIYLLFRLHVGLSISIGAGLSKVFHKVNESGNTDWNNLAFGVPDWFIEQVGEIGFKFPNAIFWAYAATYGEFIGGLCIALGFFTRFNAIQLAFQFFVISFIWYDEPNFILGMYYQQLFFFAFVLIAGFGGGKFSVENFVFRKV